MPYHQMMRREPERWIEQLTGEMSARTDRTLLASIQGKPDNLNAISAPGQHNATIPFEEYFAALDAVSHSAADGVMVCHWVDFLGNELDGDCRMVEASRRFKQ
jgi:hypothetical protein